MPLLEEDAPKDPYELFARWFREATDAGSPQPDAMALSTYGRGGPSARMVLFKGLKDGSFVFYSNYESLKGRDLQTERRTALVFYWYATHHQVRVAGTITRLTRAESAAYFHSRPRGAQLSALASRQSRVVSSRRVLELAVLELATRHPDEVPLPPDWGGMAVKPRWIEFWESRIDRLHDRLRYVRRRDGGWRVERLAP